MPGTHLQHAIRIARLAGARVKEMRDGGALTENLKGGIELVTNADLAANDIIKSEIRRQFPSHDIYSEEDTDGRTHTLDGPTWIVDPIDGTVNYASGHFMAAVSIAYADAREVRAGVVYNPFLDELFHAEKGAGAYLNDKKIQVKDVADLGECLVATGFPYEKSARAVLARRLASVLPEVRDLRRLGSAALDLCWVACGRLQGYYEGHLHAWDVAAGRLIAKEAGARIGYYVEPADGLPDDIRCDNLVVSSPKVFDTLKNLLH